MKTILRMLLFLLLPVLLLAAEPGAWRQAEPGYRWQFPRDLAAHPDYKTEWWYITGQLHPRGEPDAEPLGYQLTFFRIGLEPPDGKPRQTAWDPRDLIMAHAAVTDPATGRHTFSEVIWRTTPFLGGFGAPGDSVLAWCRAPAGTDSDWRLDYDGQEFHLQVRDDDQGLRYDLRCRPTRPPVFHGPGGYSPKSSDGRSGSLYFSQTRMVTRGEIYRGGRSVQVEGSSWLDREIFTSTLAPDQKGWDWLALNLQDGRDVMLYRLRDEAGRENFALGTLSGPAGSSHPLPGSAWNLEPVDWWDSPETGARYPVRWKLTVPGENLTLLVKAVLPDQENVSVRTGIHYWEGAVTVHPWADPDKLLGRGFVELTGYGKDSRPPV